MYPRGEQQDDHDDETYRQLPLTSRDIPFQLSPTVPLTHKESSSKLAALIKATESPGQSPLLSNKIPDPLLIRNNDDSSNDDNLDMNDDDEDYDTNGLSQSDNHSDNDDELLLKLQQQHSQFTNPSTMSIFSTLHQSNENIDNNINLARSQSQQQQHQPQQLTTSSTTTIAPDITTLMHNHGLHLHTGPENTICSEHLHNCTFQLQLNSTSTSDTIIPCSLFSPPPQSIPTHIQSTSQSSTDNNDTNNNNNTDIHVNIIPDSTSQKNPNQTNNVSTNSTLVTTDLSSLQLPPRTHQQQHHNSSRIDSHQQEFLHSHQDKTTSIQSIIAPQKPTESNSQSTKLDKPRTAVAVAIEEVQAGIQAIEQGTPKPIPTFTRIHTNTNWISDRYSNVSSNSALAASIRHTNTKYNLKNNNTNSRSNDDDANGDDDDGANLLSKHQLLQQSSVGGFSKSHQVTIDDSFYNDDNVLHTFYNPTQARSVFDDTFDVEKNQVSTQFLNCLKLRREFLFVPSYTDRRTFNMLDRPTYEPCIDGVTITRPSFDALSTSTQITSIVTPEEISTNNMVIQPNNNSNIHTTNTPSHQQQQQQQPPTPSHGNNNNQPSIMSPRQLAKSPSAAFSPFNPNSNHSTPQQQSTQLPNQQSSQQHRKVVTTTTTTTTIINPEVFLHIDANLSAELINHPDHFIYGFVNGVMHVYKKDAHDLLSFQRHKYQERKYLQLSNQLSTSGVLQPQQDPSTTISNLQLQAQQQQQNLLSILMQLPPLQLTNSQRRQLREIHNEEKTRKEDEKIKQIELGFEAKFNGYTHDIYHLALHQHRVNPNQANHQTPRMNNPTPPSNPTSAPLSTTTTTTTTDKQTVGQLLDQNSIDPLRLCATTISPQDEKIIQAIQQQEQKANDIPSTTTIHKRFTEYFEEYDNLFPVPSWIDFCDALGYVLQVANNGPCKSWSYQRLSMLDTQKNLHTQLNQDLERAQSKAVPHRDFYNVRKIDNHVHHSACMNQKHLLRFIKRKLREPEATTLPVISRDGKDLTLEQVFQSLNLTAYDLSIDTLDMHATQTFHRFDKFNAKYSPIQETRLREIFLKYGNKIRGQYLAEITREVFEDLHANKYQFAEYRISIYGRNVNEWNDLANWIIDYKLISPNVRWMIQIPRLYSQYKKSGSIHSFQDMLTNIFLPLFHVTLYPHSNPKLHQLLTLIVGFDTVDDESVRTRPFERSNPAPQRWVVEDDPPYAFFIYYLYANLRSLNHLRELVGLNTFSFRPHAGEAGDETHIASAFLCARGINHGLTLHRSPPIQYLYYLAQIGISMSPLSNNLLFLEYQKNPFPKFFNRGLNVTLSSDDPLMIHVTKEPLIEEYSVASQVWGLSHLDLCEIARNSVLQSGFDHPHKVHWLGNLYYKHSGTECNDIRATNLPDIRVQFRWELLYLEHLLLTTYAHRHNRVDVALIDPQY